MKTWGRYNQFNIETAKASFLAKVEIRPSGCWQWIGSKGGGGRYGSVALAGKVQLAHRVAWILFNDSDPGELCVCHTCDNGFCVNPEHLFLGSQGDNVRDMENKQRSKHPKHELHGRAKLTWNDIHHIRQMFKEGHLKRSIARCFPQVCRETVVSVIDGKTWSHHHVSGSPKDPEAS